jgi:DNA gyrase/topoisomerase IV subunit B
MDWRELRESTMSENTRSLIQITLDDIEWSEQVLDTCMNDKSVASRKDFITSDEFYSLT